MLINTVHTKNKGHDSNQVKAYLNNQNKTISNIKGYTTRKEKKISDHHLL